MFRVLKNRGIKGAFFNSKIIETVGSNNSSKSGKHKTSFSVHKLQARNTDEIKIGIEIALRHRGAFRNIPLTLSVEEARDLANLLNSITQK